MDFTPFRIGSGRGTRWVTTLVLLIATPITRHLTIATEVDTSQLAAPADKQIDFIRDVKPILENNCLRCHGVERPKSGFSLTSRAGALKGGDQGIDIIPGESGRSPLVHYVSGLVEDMVMPPERTGLALSVEQIGILRAWIDQGLVWERTEEPPAVEATATPILGYTWVSGDEHKFRELYWQREGWNGGLESFELTGRPAPGTKVTTSGHIFNEDQKIVFDAEKNGLGFTRLGWHQFRKYDDDSGGYYSLFTPSMYELDRDLQTDVGRAWADLGLTLPHWPRIVLGYEYRYRDGTRSTLHWGPVSEGTEARNIFPGFEDLSERVHVLRLDVDYTFQYVVISDQFRGEWYDLNSQKVNDAWFEAGTGAMAVTRSREGQTWFQGANTLRAESQITDWLFASAGYLYSHLDSDAAVNVETGNPAALDPDIALPGWHSDPITLERDSHVFSVNSALGPWEALTLTVGTQNEWTRQQGFGGASVDLAFASSPLPILLEPERFRSDLDRAVFMQNAGLRFTGLPFTTLFADARFQEETLGQYETMDGGLNPFLRNADTQSDTLDYRFGFNTSPWRRISLSAHYRNFDRQTDYDNLQKEAFGEPYQGYPGFILWRDLLSEEAQTKLAWQVNAWLKATASYQWRRNEYETATEEVADGAAGIPDGISPGGRIFAGRYEAHIPALNLTLSPWQRLYFSSTFAYQDARTVTAANGSQSVAPYEGNIYSVIASATYVLGSKSDLAASYSFSQADFEQQNTAEGLPLGIRYAQHAIQIGLRHRIGENKTLGLQYRFYHYDEPSSGGFNDFNAHAVFATLAVKFL
jgi:hypothetical protein